MAQTNDEETSLEKKLSSRNLGLIAKYNHEGQIRFEEHCEPKGYETNCEECWEDLQIEMLNKARLAALDDCKTLLERESKAWDMTMGKTPKITPSPHLVIEKALAELEALKRTFEKGSSNGWKEVLSRNDKVD